MTQEFQIGDLVRCDDGYQQPHVLKHRALYVVVKILHVFDTGRVHALALRPANVPPERVTRGELAALDGWYAERFTVVHRSSVHEPTSV